LKKSGQNPERLALAKKTYLRDLGLRKEAKPAVKERKNV